MDKHQALCKLKNLASDLGRIPTRQEARACGISHYLEKYFGSFTIAKQAAGLKPEPKKAKVLECTSVSSRLRDHKSKKLGLNPLRKVLVIGDTHFPFCNMDSLSLVYAIAEALQPDVIIQMGDLYDMFAHSKFPRTSLTFDPGEEIQVGREQAEQMWATLSKVCPKASLYQLLGNHDIRPLKRIIESYPEGEVFFDIHKWYEFPRVQLQKDYRDPLVLDGVFYTHGWSSRKGFHRDYFQANTVTGHTHRGYVDPRPLNGKVIWELNAGFLGDPTSKALSYTQSRVTQWTPGVGWIDDLGPRFIPFDEE
jgi:predicted phosphodiesterase